MMKQTVGCALFSAAWLGLHALPLQAEETRPRYAERWVCAMHNLLVDKNVD